ncbi:YciI family protein [Mycolicibacterium sp. XJ1819]
MTVLFEKVWLVEASYGADALAKREPFRAVHLARVAALLAAKTAVLASSFEDASGSLMVYRLPDEASVCALVESDVYWKEGVWSAYSVKALNMVQG